MLVDDAGEKNGESLTNGHDDGEGDCTELGDGVENEELTNS